MFTVNNKIIRYSKKRNNPIKKEMDYSNLKHKFGVKLNHTSSNTCKKVLDDETLSKSDDDFAVIDYPKENSFVQNINRSKAEEVKSPSTYLAKRIESLNIKKIEKLENTNLTLSDIDDDFDTVINEVVPEKIEEQIDEHIDINPIEENKVVYKKKVINVPNNNNTFDSFSFLSNVTNSNQGKSSTKMKSANKNQRSHKIIKSSKKKSKSISTTDNKSLDMNDIKMYENFQKLKQLEQLMQIKEFEKIKTLIDMQNMQKLISTSSIPMNNIQNISLPNIQNIIPVTNNNNIHVNKIDEENEEEPRACKQCEDVYKYLIMNNLPIKLITCVYCHRTMNRKTLDYYIEQCKKEMKEKYEKEVGVKNKNSKFDISTEKISSEDEEEESDKEEKDSDNKMIKEDESTKGTFKRLAVKKNNNTRQRERSIFIADNNTDNNNDESTNSIIHANTNINLINPSTSSNDLPQTSESLLIPTSSKNANISLAEAFRNRHSRMINNMEKRAHSIKTVKSKANINNTANREMQNIYKKLNKTNISVSSVSKEVSVPRHLNTSRSITEPSPELMNRLINGERAKMSKKEMKELNNRLYSKLPDVKGQKEDDGKKEELTKLNIVKKEYTKKLKEQVVKQFKNKKLRIKK